VTPRLAPLRGDGIEPPGEAPAYLLALGVALACVVGVGAVVAGWVGAW
jgi:hypothetical protein